MLNLIFDFQISKIWATLRNHPENKQILICFLIHINDF